MFYSTRSIRSTRVLSRFFTPLLLILCLAAAPSFATEPEENDPDPGLTLAPPVADVELEAYDPGLIRPRPSASAERQFASAVDRMEQWWLRAWQRVLGRAGSGVID
ncbi:MAG: hypothetical protein AAF560_19305 [Acidobacteriota bacterium]